MLKRTTDYIATNPWLDDNHANQLDGFEVGAMHIYRLVKLCLGDKPIPDYELCLAASERWLSVVGKIDLNKAEVHAALAKHHLQSALKARAEIGEFAFYHLALAGIAIGQSIENADSVLLPMLREEVKKEEKANQQRAEAGSKPQPFAEVVRALLREKIRYNKNLTFAKIWQNLPGEYRRFGIYEITDGIDESHYSVSLEGTFDEKPLSQRQVKERLREIKKEWKKQKIQVTP